MLLSLVLGIALFAYTYLKNGGFAHSITFDGGIRISILMPPGSGKTELDTALRKAGFASEEVQVRLTNLKSNKYDLEFGPAVEARLKRELGASEGALPGRDAKAAPGAKDAKQGGTGAKAPGAKAPGVQTSVPAGAPGEGGAGRDGKSQAGKSPQAGGQTQSADGARKKTVVDLIEEKVLSQMPTVNRESVVSREAISASYGGNLAKVAFFSLTWVIVIIGIYLSLRFDFPYALGASLALLHDVILTIGFIGALQIEPSIPVVAAVLTIIGYSINDTIVIFDRIRENMDERTPAVMRPTMDLSITQTLSRTVITSLLTLIAVLALLFGGAESLYDFALVLTFGIIVGTYSSIFIASHFVQYYQEWRKQTA